MIEITEQMPWIIKPMLAFSSEPFDSANHLFEDKYDGTRALLFANSRGTRFQNRRTRDITYRYPELAGTGADIKATEAVIDGEIVVFSAGKPDYGALQEREYAEDPAKIDALSKKTPAVFMAFDLLSVENKNIMSSPLTFRRELLGKVIKESPRIRHVPYSVDGMKHFASAVERGLEGIMAKQKDSRYLPGERSRYWLKVRSIQTMDCVVCGYTQGMESLLLGAYAGGKPVYVGRVPLGGNSLKGFQPEETGVCPFGKEPLLNQAPVWVEPKIVCEVRYQELTIDSKLRAPAFVRFRNDKEPGECTL